MAPLTPYGEPTQVIAGDSWIWEVRFPDYPSAEGWTLSYALRGVDTLDTATGEVTESDDLWTVNIQASRTVDVPQGTYVLAGYMTGSGSYAGRRHQVSQVTVTVVANVGTAAPGALQSSDERILAAIEAVLEGRITDDVQMTQINGRLITNVPILELQRLRGIYERRVWRQRNPGKMPVTRVAFRGVA